MENQYYKLAVGEFSFPDFVGTKELCELMIEQIPDDQKWLFGIYKCGEEELIEYLQNLQKNI